METLQCMQKTVNIMAYNGKKARKGCARGIQRQDRNILNEEL